MKNPFEVAARYMDTAPVPIQKIISELGIGYAEDMLPLEDSGLIECVDGQYKITVNAFHHLARKRFTAAHELGHYVYHRALIGDGIMDDAAYRSTTKGRYANGRVTAQHETQANRFAANVLMPRPLINSLLRTNGWNVPANVRQIAEAMEVSEQALRIRLGFS